MFLRSIKPFLLASLLPGSAPSRSIAIAAAMSTSANFPANNAQHCAEGGNNGKAAVIFLHGLGDSPAGWTTLSSDLPIGRPRLDAVKFVFPEAPNVEITINGGARMPGWFDLFDWPIGLSARDDREGKLAAVAQIEGEVERLRSEEGIDPSRIVVGGFSQGGAVALLAAYHRRTRGGTPFAGCVCLSGWLTLRDELVIADDVARSTPLLWGHGEYDDKVLFEQQAFGVDRLREKGVDVTDQSYPVGHGSNSNEMKDMANFLERVLFPEK